MVKMKHAIVLVAAALSIASQAHAAGAAREAKPTEARDTDTAARDREARRLERTGGQSQDTIADAARSLNASGLIKAPTLLKRIKDAIARDPGLMAIAKETLAASKDKPELTDLAAAQLEGLANLNGIERGKDAQAISALDPAVRADQSYYTLVTSVLPAARGWKGPSQKVSLDLVKESNKLIAQGTRPGEALLKAKAIVEADINSRKEAGKPDFKINLDDIFKFCKTV